MYFLFKLYKFIVISRNIFYLIFHYFIYFYYLILIYYFFIVIAIVFWGLELYVDD